MSNQSALCQREPRTEPGAPWPLVWECHSNSVLHPDHTCGQTDGSHDHLWVAWKTVPTVAPGIALVNRQSGPGIPVRCKVCGGRKCDVDTCLLRRHHGGDHEHF